jgi:hypothetical protein
VTPPPDDPEPPRLQDTTERFALPLPLPGQDEPGAPAAQSGEEDKSPAVEEPAAPPEPAPEPTEPDPDPDPAPADKSPAVEEPAGSSNGSPSFQDSPFPPPYGDEPSEGPRPEVLIGAAFAGGLLLALIFRRLGR